MAAVIGQFATILGSLMFNGAGEDTIVNGQPIIQANWADAEMARVQMFLDDNELAYPVYEVLLEPYVLDAPYNIKSCTEIVRARHGYKAAIRKVDAPGEQGSADAFVHVVCVVLPR